MNSNYIAFEGIDGSGKTSIIENLSDILNSQNKEHTIVREPGGTSVGEGIRELLLSHDYQVNPLAEALLFCAQRSQLIEEVVLPSLNNGVVVCQIEARILLLLIKEKEEVLDMKKYIN